ncbi:MAG: hypothetical protein WDA21_03675 [Bacilli bacterium]
MYNKYFKTDFKDRYKNIQEIVNATYDSFYTKEEVEKYEGLVITIKLIEKE